MMVRLFALFFAVAPLISVSELSYAAPPNNCGCTPRPEAEQIDRNDVVIEGKIINIVQKNRLRYKYSVARIQVENAIKGTRRKYVSVQAVDRPGACAVPFKVDQTIKLAARKRGASYRTNICKIFPSQL